MDCNPTVATQIKSSHVMESTTHSGQGEATVDFVWQFTASRHTTTIFEDKNYINLDQP